MDVIYGIGYKFGDRIIIGYAQPKIYRCFVKKEGKYRDFILKRYLCRCKCGFESIVRHNSIVKREADRCRPCGQAAVRKIIPKGTRFGTRIVVSDPILISNGKYRDCHYSCLCDCGDKKLVRSIEIFSGVSGHCLECRNKFTSNTIKTMYADGKIEVGDVFGKWKIIENIVTKTGKTSVYLFIARCNCGIVKKIEKHSLKNNNSMCRKCFLGRIINSGNYVKKDIKGSR